MANYKNQNSYNSAKKHSAWDTAIRMVKLPPWLLFHDPPIYILGRADNPPGPLALVRVRKTIHCYGSRAWPPSISRRFLFLPLSREALVFHRPVCSPRTTRGTMGLGGRQQAAVPVSAILGHYTKLSGATLRHGNNPGNNTGNVPRAPCTPALAHHCKPR